MGRISSPSLNKAGYSMFWNSMWDDKHNFSNLITEDEFLRITIPLIFEDNYANDLIFYLKDKKLSFDILQDYEIFYKTLNPNKITKLIKAEKFDLFVSKSWILRYQGWVILYIFIYLPIFNAFLSNSDTNMNFNKSYFNIFFNYYYNLFKVNYNSNYFFSQITYKANF